MLLSLRLITYIYPLKAAILSDMGEEDPNEDTSTTSTDQHVPFYFILLMVDVIVC
jgi:hypothetical protein